MKKIIIITSIVFAASSLYASAGQDAGVLLEQSIGARSSGMGEAYTAVGGQLDGFYFNPALLSTLPCSQVEFDYRSGFLGDNYGMVSYGAQLPDMSGFGASLTYYNSGQVTMLNTSLQEGQINGESDFVLNLGYSRRLFSDLDLAVNVKGFNSTLAGNATANSLDIGFGALYDISIIRIGASIENIGTALKYETESSPSPLIIRLGVSTGPGAVQNEPLVLAIDAVSYSNDPGIKLNAGGEYTLFNTLSIRAGYLFGYSLESFTLGVGIKVGAFALDYSYTNLYILNSSNRLSLTANFACPAVPAQSPTELVAETVTPAETETPQPAPTVVTGEPQSTLNKYVLMDSDIPSQYYKKLDAFIKLVKEGGEYKQIIVYGYTDDRGRLEYNQKLSERRALRVVNYLVKKGLLDIQKISYFGRRDFDPVAPNNTPEHRALNRRTEIYLIR